MVVCTLAEVVDHAARAQLLDGFDHVSESVHVSLRQQAAMRVHWNGAVEAGVAGPHPRPGLARTRETKTLDVHQANAGERVVKLGEVDIGRRQPRALIELAGGAMRIRSMIACIRSMPSAPGIVRAVVFSKWQPTRV